MDIYGFIYITTNMVNGKKYIGQKKIDNEGKYKKYLGSGQTLKKALKKYGKDNFEREIVAFAYSKDELNNLEIDFINYHNATHSDNYYNIAYGGNSGNKLEGKKEYEINEFKNKISESTKGEKNPMFGKKINKENHPMYGKHHSEEAKRKMSKNNKKVWQGKHFSEEHKNKMSENSGRAKKVICITTGRIFKSAKEGADYYNCDNSGILKNCKEKAKSCGRLEDGTKLVWSFFYEENKVA